MSRKDCQWYLKRVEETLRDGDHYMTRIYFSSLMNTLIDKVFPYKKAKKRRKRRR